MKIKVEQSILNIDQSSWNSLTHTSNPFHNYAWLSHLENTSCTTKLTGWEPRYFIAYEQDKIIGAVISYVKTHSYGEFIFDWQWAQSYAHAGINYYPKLVLASAFTPVTNKRIITNKNVQNEDVKNLLLNFIINYAKDQQYSSIHSLFCTEDELAIYEKFNFKTRLSYQFHFNNHNYIKFEDYLMSLKSQKRKTINKERNYLDSLGISYEYISGNEISKTNLEFVWDCYSNTIYEKYSTAYLSKSFFINLPEDVKQQTLLIIAKQNNSPIASTFNLFDSNRLYGRYWGNIQAVKFLHFECSLYQLIKWAIKHNLKTIEAGAQGEHKFLRGFEPTLTYSAHLMFRQDAMNMVEEYLQVEKKRILKYFEYYNQKSPYKTT